MDVSLEGWDMVSADSAEWVPWVGSAGEARAKVLGTADGYKDLIWLSGRDHVCLT